MNNPDDVIKVNGDTLKTTAGGSPSAETPTGPLSGIAAYSELKDIRELISQIAAEDNEPGKPGIGAYSELKYIRELITLIASREPGQPGQPGRPGQPGIGVPAGGEVGQVLTKRTDDDFDTIWNTLTGGGGSTGGVSSWNDLTDKPSTFPPSTHSHTRSDISDFDHSHDISDLTGVATAAQGAKADSALQKIEINTVTTGAPGSSAAATAENDNDVTRLSFTIPHGAVGAVGASVFDVWKGEGHTGDEADFLRWVKASAGGQGHVGEIFWWPLAQPPADALYCDGRAISRTEFAQLFGVIGVTFGAGNGSTTFNLPDMRGEFVRGYDPTAMRDPQGGTRGIGKNQGDTRNHTHNLDGSGYALALVGSGTHSQSIGAFVSTPRWTSNRGQAGTVNTTERQNDFGTPLRGRTAGLTTSAEVRPTNINLLPCIRYKLQELPWCSGIIANRSLTANVCGPLRPIPQSGDENLVNENRFIASEAGMWELRVGSHRFVTSIAATGMHYVGITKNVEAVTTGGFPNVGRITLNGFAGAGHANVLTMHGSTRLEQGEYLSAFLYSSAAQSGINADGVIATFDFFKIR